ncbi:hypothetical protein AgCh_018550 [Apium graveolens]
MGKLSFKWSPSKLQRLGCFGASHLKGYTYESGTLFLDVYADGSRLDILQNQWSPIYDVAVILTSIEWSSNIRKSYDSKDLDVRTETLGYIH